jgi:hypothetical protein
MSAIGPLGAEQARVTSLAERRRLRAVAPAVTSGPLLRCAVYVLLAGVAALQIWAGVVDYALRVISDNPTFIALVRGLGEHPFAAQSPYLDADVETQHATPYTQLLGLVWRFLDVQGSAPEELSRLLALAGVVVFAVTLVAVGRYARAVAGSRAGWLAIPILLALFGPSHVIWASDLTVHGALYAGFYPQNVALAFLLATLLLVRRRTPGGFLLATLAAGATLTIHPFTGLLLGGLLAAQSVADARRQDLVYVAGPLVYMGGFGLGLLWPAYSLDRALGEVGIPGALYVALCATAPLVARYARLPRFERVRTLAVRLDGRTTEFVLATAGAAVFTALCLWQRLLIGSAETLASQRLAIYWVEDRWRWPLMLSLGTVGMLGLLRLARRGSWALPVWFAGCATIGVAGAAGLPLPIWYRFVLLCQVPLAIGVALVVAETKSLWTRGLVAATVCVALLLKVTTLVWQPTTITYFGSPLQESWSLGHVVPAAPGLVATDPQTSYFVPATTGHRTLTISQGHVSSRHERELAEDGYQLLRRFYAHGPDWWQAGQEMWLRGVRYLVIEKQTTLDPPTLADFTWQNALLTTPGQQERLGRYFYASNRIGVLLHDSPEYVVYRLDEHKLFGPAGAPR